MNHKAAETTYSINTFGLGTVSKSIVQWWFKKFCKGDKSLENEECSGWPSEVDNWEDHWSWFCLKTMILLKLYEKSLRNSTLTILWSFGIWSKWQRWKGLISGCLRSWLKKKLSLWSVIFSYNNKPFLNWLWLVAKSNDQLSGWTKKKLQSTSKAKLVPKKRSWSLFGGLLPIWPIIAFWILASPYVWEVCSANQWDAPKTAVPTVGIGQQKGPNSSPQQCPTSHHTTNTSEVEWIGLWSFASSAIFPWPLTNWLPLLQASQQLFIERLLP